jgi:hypothetical protein
MQKIIFRRKIVVTRIVGNIYNLTVYSVVWYFVDFSSAKQDSTSRLLGEIGSSCGEAIKSSVMFSWVSFEVSISRAECEANSLDSDGAITHRRHFLLALAGLDLCHLPTISELLGS